VQVTIRLGWQARADVVEAPVLQVFGDSLADERWDSTDGFFWIHSHTFDWIFGSLRQVQYRLS
jgi:hypothetical protein